MSPRFPRIFEGGIDPPKVTNRPFRKGKRGRGRQTPRWVSGRRPPQTVEEIVHRNPAFENQEWERWQIKNTPKGPIVWDVKHALITVKAENGLPGPVYHLLVARNAANPEEVKSFMAGAPPETPVETRLRVAFSRWRIERCYEDQKGEIGLDPYAGRRDQGLKRHLILSCVSYLFLSWVRESERRKKSAADDLPGSQGPLSHRSIVVA